MSCLNQAYYRDQVWSAMHNSTDRNRRTVAMRLYLDESGGKDPNTPDAIVGGLLIRAPEYQAFEDSWESLLKEFSIKPPLHMKEFGRPDGRFAYISDCRRRDLFNGVAGIITKYPQMTLSASVNNQDVLDVLDAETAKEFSVYGVCFLLAAHLNHRLAVHNNYPEAIPMFLDTGNPHKGRVTSMHGLLMGIQKRGSFLHVGALTFDDDTNFGVLQAADVVAWAARRRVSNIPLGSAFEPLQGIFPTHRHEAWSKENLREMGTLAKSLVEEMRAESEASERDDVD